MALSEWIEKIGRTIFEAPFGSTQISKDAPELAEIRLAVLDEVKAKSHRVSGREVFPYNVVRITIRGIPEEQSGVFRGAFFTQFFEQELRTGLSRGHYRFPDDLQIEVQTTPQLPGPRERWLWIETESRERPPAPVTQTRNKPARLIVVKGAANERELVLNKARINIGRTLDVYRTDGPSRRNDLAFTEDNDINRSVSREHAHIIFHRKTGEYRIYNDRWYKPGNQDGGCGLWIMRDGLTQEVHRNARGTKLQPGDEIHLGRAVLKFQMK